MFGVISGTQQAMLWLAVIMSAGFTCFVLFAIVPLTRALREQNEVIKRFMQDEKYFPKSTKLEKISQNPDTTDDLK